MTDPPVHSAFHQVQEALGAEFGDWDGWLWTTGFGDRNGEYAAVRDAAGIWDCSALIKCDFHGPDALRAADRLIANDVLAYGPGRVRYAPLLDEYGRLLADATIYVFGPRLVHDQPVRPGRSPARRLVRSRGDDRFDRPRAAPRPVPGPADARDPTSPTGSARLGTIALAILERAAAAPGTRVEVALADGSTFATVGEPALYDPHKRRPRA
jgi:glycine cleavage system aminomethyltransferase T